MSQSEISGWITSENNKKISVIVGSAEFHKGGYVSKSYVDFKIEITIDGDTLSSRHRFSEFEGIRDLLRVTYHKYGMVVPPLPPKSSLSSTTDVESSFVKERTEGLTLFCRAVVMNPFFRNDNSWIEFVTGSAVSTENTGERMIAGALGLLEQPFKLTVDSRIDTIKEEVSLIETSVKAVIGSLRKLAEAEKACMAA
ncbi:MAG: PX domain-containing protein, partial [Actinomycetota bacterium]|nr:PX domain-containing protein [Actinomycetota bacterium]